ncbi:DUF3089 domain-containing protein [Sphingomonas sp. KRR8]|uniref:DUF3089 domain-containing protein n=1 Tax=Sphingomonas sp. KRR8 TaxID=2942996 RepID=UPI0020223CB9|nr:DUF3089 domain-containing protein [Sphingomonas sp. KRR8]URD59948.1 DUF3089 domain-containing protein [Sphingomonas sp. KRR8]
MIAALLLAATAAVPPLPLKPATGPATDYSSDAHWLCLPGRTDVCSTPLRTTALNPNGYGSNGQSSVAKNPPVDCFYVYPTVSRDRGYNSDLAVSEERSIAETQATRFAGVCKVYAPIYRQMTLGAITAVSTGGDVSDAYALAYRDVSAAWKNYLATRNKGRPVILIGHSQGSLMLQQLIAREIEGTASARLMRLAILPGINTLVPEGKLVGGTFASTPLCSRTGQSGCVIAYSSFRTNNPPPPGALFGYSPVPGMTVGCVNPAAPGSRDWRPLDSYWFANSAQPVPGGPITWSTEGPPPTPYLRTEGLVSARCVNDGPRGYLEIRVNADPNDKRTDRVGGEVGALGFFLPGWGMHLSDVAEAQGDLLRLVESVSR